MEWNKLNFNTFIHGKSLIRTLHGKSQKSIIISLFLAQWHIGQIIGSYNIIQKYFKRCHLIYNAIKFYSEKTPKLEPIYTQRAKKVLSDSPGLVDFAIGLVNSVFNLPDGQVMFYEEFE